MEISLIVKWFGFWWVWILLGLKLEFLHLTANLAVLNYISQLCNFIFQNFSFYPFIHQPPSPKERFAELVHVTWIMCNIFQYVNFDANRCIFCALAINFNRSWYPEQKRLMCTRYKSLKRRTSDKMHFPFTCNSFCSLELCE